MRIVAVLALALACAYAGPDMYAQPWRAPIKVWAENDYLDTYAISLDYAIDMWNGATECRLFERTSQRSRADVFVRIGPYKVKPDGTVIAGEAFMGLNPRLILYRSPGDIRHAYLTAAHELGHILGFGHDRWEHSVMFKNIRPDLSVVLIPTQSAQRARSLYCRK